MGNSVKNKPLENLIIVAVLVSKTDITATFNDGRKVSIPLSWFPSLEKATTAQLKNFEISPAGYGIHFPEIDEDISIKAFLD